MAFLEVCRTRGFVIRVLAVSGLLALLQLSASLYVLVVYDQVLPSGSVPALAWLTGLAGALHVAFAGLDAIRARMVCRAGLRFVEHVEGRLLSALADRSLGFSFLDDVERVRRFMTGAGPCAAFDLLWLPAFLAVAFFLHPVLGMFACSGVAVLASATFLAERRSRMGGRRLQQARHTRYVLAWDLHAGLAGAERRARWQDAALSWDALSRCYSERTLHTAEHALFSQAFGKGLRLVLQSAGFGVGALLAVEGLLSAGGLVASSLVLARTFACLDGALAHWHAFVAAHESCQRLFRAFGVHGDDRDPGVVSTCSGASSAVRLGSATPGGRASVRS